MSPDAKWTIGGWQSKSNNLFKLERGFFGQLVEGNCGSHCGFCYPYGLMFVDLIVPRDVKNWKYFGEQNRSLMESTDGGWKNRIFKLSSGLCLQACITFPVIAAFFGDLNKIYDAASSTTRPSK